MQGGVQMKARYIVTLLVLLMTVRGVRAADMEAVLDSDDGSSAFVVKDSGDAVKASIASDGQTVITGTLTVQTNVVAQHDADRGLGARSMLTIGGGNDVEIGSGADGYYFGTAVGFEAKARSSGTAVGYQANATNTGVAVGDRALGANGGTAIGNMAIGNDGTAVGFQADGSIEGAAVGRFANAWNRGVAMGHDATARGNGVGVGHSANGRMYGAAVGYGANGAGSNVAVGAFANAQAGRERIAIGHNVTNAINDSAAIRGTLYLDGGTNVMMRPIFGSGAWIPLTAVVGDFRSDGSVPMSGNLNMGGQILTNVTSIDYAGSATAAGRGADARTFGTAVGSGAVASNRGAAVGYLTSGHTYGAALGRDARGEEYGAAVGYQAWGYNSGLAIGHYADGYAGGVALGVFANGARTNIAIGYRANARGGTDRISIGNNVSNHVNNSASIRGTLYLDGGTGIMTRATFGSGAWSAKAFVIDHPLDPENKVLRHFCVEGPEVWNIYAGNAVLVNGGAVVELPDYYEALNLVGSEIYSLTVIGGRADVWVEEEVSGNRFRIAGERDLKVSWTIKVLRNDPACLEDLERRPVEQLKSELAPGQTAAENIIMNTVAVR